MIADPSILSAVETLEARTKGHPRFRNICDPEHPDYDPRKIPAILAMANGQQAQRPEGPSFLRKVVNFAGAVVEHVVTGRRILPEEESQRRLRICESCTEFFDPAKRRCSHIKCGCDMDIKATWAEQKCPVGKWLAVPETPETV